jgi:hypothetical protein
MTQNIRIENPEDGWPVVHTTEDTAGIYEIASTPGPDSSWYLTGYTIQGATDQDGFVILRRNSVQFAAAADSFTVSDNAALEPATSDFAIEFGIKAASTAVSVAKILHKHDGSDDGYIISTDATGHLVCTIGDGTDTAAITSRNVIIDNKWHQVIINIEAGETDGLTLYIDGESAATAVDISDVDSVTGGATDLTIVGENSKTFAISALGLYKGGILSEADRASRWGRGPGGNGCGSKFTGSETNISAAWNLDEGSGTSHSDLVGSNDGISASTVWLEGEGLPIDSHTLKNTVFITGNNGSSTITFPHAIKIGRNNPLQIDVTAGIWGVQFYGYQDIY